MYLMRPSYKDAVATNSSVLVYKILYPQLAIYRAWTTPRVTLSSGAFCWLLSIVAIPTNVFGIKSSMVVMTNMGQYTMLPSKAAQLDLMALLMRYIPYTIVCRWRIGKPVYTATT